MTGISITTIICILLPLLVCIIAVFFYVLEWHSSHKQLCKHFNEQIETSICHHVATCPALYMQSAASPPKAGAFTNKRQLGKALNTYMEQHYPLFMQQLRQHTHQPLTPTEEMICIFSKLAMRNKQVAEILKISLSSVTKTRYHAKNKMNIAPNENLDEWLHRHGEPISTLPPCNFFYPVEADLPRQPLQKKGEARLLLLTILICICQLLRYSSGVMFV